jgi:hypothetical protein
MTIKIALPPEVIECVNSLQTGGAELWNTTIRKALECVVCSDSHGNAEERLQIAEKLLYMQDMISTFIQEGGAQ